ncbi:unnamed protein product [Cladocopium goreaui]|uniref:Selenoprotein O n=1 Tax=Cladocopium goreaui TaxID=2562237 RepID=A0A9P1DBS4_9DINO|nr:unnamed protein product [Cladocopium goreaui]
MVSSMSFGLPKTRKKPPAAVAAGANGGNALVAQEEPAWDRIDGMVMLTVGDQQELVEVDPEMGPRVYTYHGEMSFFSLKNLVSSSTLEVPQKQWKDYTSSEKKVACYMAAKQNQSLRAFANQASVEELLAKQEEAKKAEEALIKQLDERCEAERKKASISWSPVPLEAVTEKHKKKSPGMFYGLEFPWTAQMLQDFGAKWLTEAFHRAGSLESTNRVTSLKVEDTKVTGGNNAGKFLLTVRYAKERESLHTKLFAKVPFPMTKETKQDRLSSSVLKQPMDFCEINTYRLAETKLPTQTPKFYYGDISNETTNYIIITERVPFVGMGGRKKAHLKPYEVEGPYDKCKDYELRGDPKEYYSLIMEVSGRIAGADKSGRMGTKDFVLHNFPTLRAPPGDMRAWGANPTGPSGSAPQARQSQLRIGIQFFSQTVAHFFPSYAVKQEFIDKFTDTLMKFSAYMMEIECWKHEDLNYVALSHANLNVDNAYYWRDEAGKLCCGVLDWGGFGQSCLGHKLWWYFNCSEFELLKDHFEHFLKTFIDSYHESGGPKLDLQTLERMVKLTCLQNLSVMVAAVPDCLRQIPAQDWASVKDRKDWRIDDNLGDKSTLRTTLRSMDNGLRMIEEIGIDRDLQWFIDEIWVKKYHQEPKTRAMIFGED